MTRVECWGDETWPLFQGLLHNKICRCTRSVVSILVACQRLTQRYLLPCQRCVHVWLAELPQQHLLRHASVSVTHQAHLVKRHGNIRKARSTGPKPATQVLISPVQWSQSGPQNGSEVPRRSSCLKYVSFIQWHSGVSTSNHVISRWCLKRRTHLLSNGKRLIQPNMSGAIVKATASALKAHRSN